MAEYQRQTGAIPEPAPTTRRTGTKQTRAPRGLDAIIMTSSSRWLKKYHAEGKKKAQAVVAVMENPEQIATAKGESITPELHAKIEARAAEIFGKK